MIVKRIKLLDSFRGLAALTIVFHHVYTRFNYLYDQKQNLIFHSIAGFISGMNREAVLFFFILSGFSIRLSLLKGMPVKKTLLNDYLFRRFNRILPLYLIAIVFTVIAGFIINKLNTEDFSVINFFGNLFFLQISTSYKGYWFPPYGGNGPLWSISFEMFYYLFFPFFMFCMIRLFERRFPLSITKMYILCIAFFISLGCIVINHIAFLPYIAFATLFYVWYTGFFLAELYLEGRFFLNINLVLILFLMFFAWVLQVITQSASLQMLFLGSLISSIFYGMYILRKKLPLTMVTFTENAFNAVFYKLGKGSYALYLFHYPLVLIFLYYRVESLWQVITAMALLSIICIRVEKYFVKKRFSFLRISYFK